jgi:hypothetical protein
MSASTSDNIRLSPLVSVEVVCDECAPNTWGSGYAIPVQNLQSVVIRCSNCTAYIGSVTRMYYTMMTGRQLLLPAPATVQH